LGRSHGGFGTKLHLVVDGGGVPLAAVVSAGQAHESRFATPLLDRVRVARPEPGRPRQRPAVVVGDRGYSYARVRAWLRRRGIRAIIPERRDQSAHRHGRPPAFDLAAYRRRNVVERCVGWLKECRLIATRFEKLAVHYAAQLTLAMIHRILRHNFADKA
jgi:transposase